MTIELGGAGNPNAGNQPATPSSMIDRSEPSNPTSSTSFTYTPTKEQTRSTMSNMKNTLSSLAANSRAFVALTPSGEAEVIQSLIKITDELLEKTQKQVEVKLLPVSSPSLVCSALIVAVNAPNRQSAGLAYHVLVLADTDYKRVIPKTVSENIQGVGQVEKVLLYSDAYNKYMASIVHDTMARAFPDVPQNKMHFADAEVVPPGFDYKNVDSVRRLMSNAMLAAGTILQLAIGGTSGDFRLPEDASNMGGVVRQLVHQPQRTGSDGLPIRTDVILEFNESSRKNNNQYGTTSTELNGDDQDQTLFRLGGYLDLAWNPEPSAAAPNQFLPQYGQQQPQNQQHYYLYTPRFIVTMMDQGELNTLPGQLLGLASINALSQDANWAMSFKRPMNDEFDLRDLGAIGYEANLERNQSGFGQAIDTRSSNFTDASLVTLIQTFIRPNLAVCIDVPECGPMTWMVSTWLSAARGNPDAIRLIVNAADYLTNNNFSKLFNASKGVAAIERNRIHMGYYTARDNTRRDIRDVDHLAVLNYHGPKDPAVARDFSDTYNRIGYPIEQRLFARKKIIESVIGHDPVYTGYAERIILNPEMIRALADAVQMTGLVIRPQTPFQDINGQTRYSASFLNDFGMGTNAAFQNNYNNGVQGGYSTGGAYTRWS